MKSEENEIPERTIGEVPVVARLAIGGESLKLVMTDRRIIVAHMGKSGAGALATASILGRLGAAIEVLVRGRKHGLGRGKTESMRPEVLLRADKDNFELSYSEIVTIELSPSYYRLGITILTRQDKFQFFTPMPEDAVADLLRSLLPDKLTISR